MIIRKAVQKDFKGMVDIAKSLHPRWFDNFAINIAIPLDLKIHKGFVAEKEDKIIGFLTYSSNNGEVKISWIGVNPNFQRQRIGVKLIENLEKELKQIGADKLTVETVAESVNYAPYEITRAFYKKMGFTVGKVKKIKSKDTGEEFDMATFVKNL